MLGTRIITGLVLGVVVTATLLFLPTGAAMTLLGLLWLAGAWEWAALARFGSSARSAYVGGFLVIMAGATIFPLTVSGMEVTVAVALAGWAVALVGVLTYPRPIAPLAVAFAGPVALLPAWILLGFLHATVPLGPELALLILVIVWAADVGAYAAGRAFGRVKLAPKVSPGKTWEGVGGGLVLTLVVAGIASRWLGLPLVPVLVVAAGAAALSVLGDLTVSMLKRNVGVKDSGRLLPGHGGVMDRIDGLVAAVPVYAAGLCLVGLID